MKLSHMRMWSSIAAILSTHPAVGADWPPAAARAVCAASAQPPWPFLLVKLPAGRPANAAAAAAATMRQALDSQAVAAVAGVGPTGAVGGAAAGPRAGASRRGRRRAGGVPPGGAAAAGAPAACRRHDAAGSGSPPCAAPPVEVAVPPGRGGVGQVAPGAISVCGADTAAPRAAARAAVASAATNAAMLRTSGNAATAHAAAAADAGWAVGAPREGLWRQQPPRRLGRRRHRCGGRQRRQHRVQVDIEYLQQGSRQST